MFFEWKITGNMQEMQKLAYFQPLIILDIKQKRPIVEFYNYCIVGVRKQSDD